MVYDETLDIIINNESSTEQQVSKRIRLMDMSIDTAYFAFYLSHFQKTDTNITNQSIYFKVKETLLKRSIMSQTIDKNKFSERNFGLSIANISIAMVAKLGGIPWALANKPEEELIIGFGAHTSQKSGIGYVGSSFCFDNRGLFQEFDCWPAEEAWELHSTLAVAIKNYRARNQNVERVVIHYYKEMKKKDFEKIDRLIDELDEKIPVIVIRFNSSFEQNELVMDKQHPQYLPENGCYVRLKHHQYVLHINNNENNTNCKEAPLPLKMSFQSNRAGLLDDNELIERLMRQVYEFSLLHWRSIRQPRLPVTVSYPQLVASIIPWFSGEVMTGVGRERLWFL